MHTIDVKKIFSPPSFPEDPKYGRKIIYIGDLLKHENQQVIWKNPKTGQDLIGKVCVVERCHGHKALSLDFGYNRVIEIARTCVKAKEFDKKTALAKHKIYELPTRLMGKDGVPESLIGEVRDKVGNAADAEDITDFNETCSQNSDVYVVKNDYGQFRICIVEKGGRSQHHSTETSLIKAALRIRAEMERDGIEVKSYKDVLHFNVRDPKTPFLSGEELGRREQGDLIIFLDGEGYAEEQRSYLLQLKEF